MKLPVRIEIVPTLTSDDFWINLYEVEGADKQRLAMCELPEVAEQIVTALNRDDGARIAELIARAEKGEALAKQADEIIAEANRLVTARPSPWVPTSERLPTRPGHYYVTLYDGRVGTSAFYVGSFDRSVIAWIPLPEDDPYTPDAVPLEGIETMEDENANQ